MKRKKIITDSNMIEIVKGFIDDMVPDVRLSLSAWVKEHRRLSKESSALSRFSFEKTPYIRGIMDALSDPNIKEVAVMSSAQVGKTELANNLIAWLVDNDPGPILMILPTLMLAYTYSKQRLRAMIRDTPRLKSKVLGRRGEDTQLEKNFVGGYIAMAGANSPAQLCSRPIRYLIIDEIDRMGATSEGDPVSLAVKRTATYGQKRKVLYLSTPGDMYVSRIHQLYKQGDQAKFYVPCPVCNHFQILIFKNIIFKHVEDVVIPGSARYRCENEECQALWTDSEKQRTCQKGEWRSDTENAPSWIKTFWINEYYSGFRVMDDIAQDFMRMKDREDTLRVFTNTSEGLPFEVKITRIDYMDLYRNRREVYDDSTFYKREILAVTAGVDVQKDRLVYEIVAWGERYESWSIEYRHILGETAKNDVWGELQEMMEKPVIINDKEYFIDKVAVDCNFQTAVVKRFVMHMGSKYMAVIGKADQLEFVKVPSLGDTNSKRKLKGGFKAYYVGVDKLKEEFYTFLVNQEYSDEDGNTMIPVGFCHFPADYSSDYFKEITSEVQKVQVIQGNKKYKWEVIEGRRNEALDCRIYARAAAYNIGYDRMQFRRPKTHGNIEKKDIKMWDARDVRF